jgi:hypothetical protein
MPRPCWLPLQAARTRRAVELNKQLVKWPSITHLSLSLLCHNNMSDMLLRLVCTLASVCASQLSSCRCCALLCCGSWE